MQGEDIAILGLRARTQRKVSFKIVQRLILILEALKNVEGRGIRAAAA